MDAKEMELFSTFQDVLSEVGDVIREEVYWGWDGRLQAAFVVAQSSHNRALNDALARCFTHRWDIESIQSAPANVREVVDSLVGLRDGQFIYTAEPDDFGRTLYAAFWPWANSDLISIRISLMTKDGSRLSPADQGELLNRTLKANH